MDSTRQNKISRLIQKELSDLFQKQTQGTHGEELLKNITSNMRTIRYDLGQRVRHQLRIIPELKFFADDSLDYAEHIDNLIKEAKGDGYKTPEGPEEDYLNNR